jgi:hypothetical protein
MVEVIGSNPIAPTITYAVLVSSNSRSNSRLLVLPERKSFFSTGIDAAIVTSAHERPEKPIIQRIIAFFADFNHRFGTVREPCYFFCQKLVPQFPAELLSQQLSNLATAASVFALSSTIPITPSSVLLFQYCSPRNCHAFAARIILF